MISGINTHRIGAADPFKQFDVEFSRPSLRASQVSPILEGAVPLDGMENLEPSEGPTFGEVLKNALQSVESEKAKAESIALDFATGKPVDIHTMMIQVAKADVMMQVTSAVVSKSATSLNQLLQTQV
jgi:flagellar hook-basal body complex protein FliE